VRAKTTAAAVLGAFVLAGISSGASTPYSAKPTRACLRARHVSTILRTSGLAYPEEIAELEWPLAGDERITIAFAKDAAHAAILRQRLRTDAAFGTLPTALQNGMALKGNVLYFADDIGLRGLTPPRRALIERCLH
jgi:hypothetical protein